MATSIDVEMLVELMTDRNELIRRRAAWALDDSIVYLVDPCERGKHKQTFQRIYDGLYKKLNQAITTQEPELAYLMEPSVMRYLSGWLDLMAPYLDIKQPITIIR